MTLNKMRHNFILRSHFEIKFVAYRSRIIIEPKNLNFATQMFYLQTILATPLKIITFQ